jgi:hypothetical protein
MEITSRKVVSKTINNSLIFLTVMMFFASGVVSAEQSTSLVVPEPQPVLQTPSILTMDPFEYMDGPRDYLSGKFVGLSRKIDRFFGNDRNYQDSNNSLMQFDLVKIAGYGGSRKLVLSGRAKFDFPSTVKRLHLLLETNPDKNVTGEPLQQQATSLSQVLSPESYAAAIRYENIKVADKPWRFSSDLGVKLHGVNTNPFARVQGSYEIKFNEWFFKLSESAFWFNTTGIGETSLLEAERNINPSMLLRSTSNATWLNDKNNFDLRQDLTLYQTFNDVSAVFYQASAIGVSHPKMQLSEYVLSVVLRYRIHKQWAYLDINPQMHFPEKDNFRGGASINIRLEMLLGGLN